MVISGSLTWCVHELLKGANGKCSGGSNIPYFTQQETMSDKSALGVRKLSVFCETLVVSMESVGLNL